MPDESRTIISEFGDDRRAADIRKDRKGTEEPWKRPGQSSQDPSSKPPPKRERDDNDNKTA